MNPVKSVWQGMETEGGEFALLFCLGAVGYYGLECAFRGHSHWTMALTGGTCLWLLYLLGRTFPQMPPLAFCLIGGMLITVLEYTVGDIVNIRLGWQVWDYSRMPLNYRGQICLLFSFFWCLLCLPAQYLVKWIRIAVFGYPQ